MPPVSLSIERLGIADADVDAMCEMLFGGEGKWNEKKSPGCEEARANACTPALSACPSAIGGADQRKDVGSPTEGHRHEARAGSCLLPPCPIGSLFFFLAWSLDAHVTGLGMEYSWNQVDLADGLALQAPEGCELFLGAGTVELSLSYAYPKHCWGCLTRNRYAKADYTENAVAKREAEL
ncbi:hypothetical protein GGTG_12554 [Gaeumannomyces tritici R3-111a-1]|uniref:Uncharacterized protein n=1 Tax=Gaeumannomyces tritici (strain R3-111a-1) TaxID=644352 RepID=J3PGC9_GAET3|nr:hypothetical protein GGTG_12554 [Gaeumannomyces tritici R3-111a-1]EJT69670.1 hypothetical protein GGTG_12554 [Gaeumannomyces tritici R3-111a-1]